MYSLTSEPFKLDRDVEAIAVPTGETIELPAGVVGYITQALGGSFTIFVDGSMFMILGHNADALGKEPLAAPVLPENATQQDVEQAVWAQLKTVYDPEIPVSIVELGLVGVGRDGQGACAALTEQLGNSWLSSDAIGAQAAHAHALA